MIKFSFDRYNGVIADTTTVPGDRDIFEREIVQLIDSVKNKKLLWINISSEQSDLIPILIKLGFEFHHCDNNNLAMTKKLSVDSFVPAKKDFIAGVGAIVIHNGRLLIVKGRLSSDYKLPGGHVEKHESIREALKREVFEETGIETELESIVNIGHFRNGQFGESNLYIVCTATALSHVIRIGDPDEISEAGWIDIPKFLSSEQATPYDKSVVGVVVNNTAQKLKEQPVKLRVADGEIFF